MREINLSLSYAGRGGELVVASGAVGQTSTYVVEVIPQAVAPSTMKQSAYWRLGDGFDTMYTLWNATETAQDIVFEGATGIYNLPVRLEPGASRTLSIAQLAAASQPDEEGNVIPLDIRAGSAVFASATGLREGMNLVVSGGVFNIATATCGGSCTECCGYSGFAVSEQNWVCLLGQTAQCHSQATYCNGQIFDFTSSSDWSTSNTSIATINNSSSKGLLTGVSPWSVDAIAPLPLLGTYTGRVCGSPSPPPCPTGRPFGTGGGQVVPQQYTLTASSFIPTNYAIGDTCGFGTDIALYRLISPIRLMNAAFPQQTQDTGLEVSWVLRSQHD